MSAGLKFSNHESTSILIFSPSRSDSISLIGLLSEAIDNLHARRVDCLRDFAYVMHEKWDLVIFQGNEHNLKTCREVIDMFDDAHDASGVIALCQRDDADIFDAFLNVGAKEVVAINRRHQIVEAVKRALSRQKSMGRTRPVARSHKATKPKSLSVV